MASPQSENGHIDIANEIAEALMRTNLSSYQSRILWVIWRQTYGWHKKADWISNSQFVEMTGLKKSHVSRTVKQLKDRGIVTNTGNKIAFNKDYSGWRELPKLVTVTSRGNKVTSTGQKLPVQGHTKETLQKKLGLRGTNVPLCPHQKIIEIYHEILPEFPVVRIWDDKNKSQLRARWLSSPDYQYVEWWRKYFLYVRKSDFLMGNTNPQITIQPDLEWLVKKANFGKIANGRYHKQKKEDGIDKWARIKEESALAAALK